MFSVPSVTMKGGSLTWVINRPLNTPNSVVTPMPQRMASGTGRPASTASLLITMLPSAITMPQDRSMPAVRITSVWPMAMTPTTINCCRISEKFAPLRNCGLWVENTRQAITSAISGPSVPIWGSLDFRSGMGKPH